MRHTTTDRHELHYSLLDRQGSWRRMGGGEREREIEREECIVKEKVQENKAWSHSSCFLFL